MDSKSILDDIAEAAAVQNFVPSYVEIAPLEERKLEGLGIELAKYVGWDGIALLKLFEAALEDANFHHEAEQVAQMILDIGG